MLEVGTRVRVVWGYWSGKKGRVERITMMFTPYYEIKLDDTGECVGVFEEAVMRIAESAVDVSAALLGDDRPAPDGDAWEAHMLRLLAAQDRREVV